MVLEREVCGCEDSSWANGLVSGGLVFWLLEVRNA